MNWAESLFIENASLYAPILESQWKAGQEHAKLISALLKEKGLKRCRVLDVPCGIGRISVPLAKLGYSVTGVDMSRYFISLAKKKAKQYGVAKKTAFATARMKQVDRLFPRDAFDAALNIFTSVGYGTEQDDLDFFTSLRRVVRRGGIFLIGRLANRDYIFSHFAPTLYDETERMVVLHTNELDALHSKEKSVWRFYQRKGKTLKLAAVNDVELRLYSPHELTSMLGKTGWKVSSVYDSLTYRRPFSPDNPGLNIVAEAK